MSQEILYTSAPRGLRQGSRGYCTVLATPGMSKTFVEQLESLSGYTHVYPAHVPEAKLNPVNFSHLILSTGGRQYHVLSRIADAGLDYSKRSNKLAHHVALEKNELVPGGPAWVLSQPNFMEAAFHGEPTIIQAGRKPPAGDPPAAVCSHWQKLTGDAGWAGALAETALQKRPQQAVIVFRPGMELLPLFVEALNLLPPQRRWEVSFSTYFTRLPTDLTCQWRCVLADTAECKSAMRLPQALVIDLSAPLGKAPGGALTAAARTGKRPAWPKLESPAHMDVRSTVQVDALARPDAQVTAPHAAAITPRGSATDGGNFLEAYAADLGPQIAVRSGRRSALLNGWSVAVAILMFLVGIAGGFYAGLLAGRPATVVAVADASKKNLAKAPGKPDASKAAASPSQAPAPTEAPPSATNDSPAPEPQPKPVEQPPAPEQSPQAASSENPPTPENSAPPTPEAVASASLPAKPTPAPEDLWKDLKKRQHILELPPVIGKSSGLGSEPGVQELAKLVVANPADCVLELIGLAEAFPMNDQFELKRTDDPQPTWAIWSTKKTLKKAPPISIASFVLKDGVLIFKWSPRSVEKVNIDGVPLLDRLQNCLLCIKVGDQFSQPCKLRKPLVLAPATFSFEKEDRSISISGIQNLSETNRGRVCLAINPIQGVQSLPEIIRTTKQNQLRIVFPLQLGPPPAGFNIDWSPVEIEVEARPIDSRIVIMARTKPLGEIQKETTGRPQLPLTTYSQAKKQRDDANAEMRRLKPEVDRLSLEISKLNNSRQKIPKDLEAKEAQTAKQQDEWTFRHRYWESVVILMEQLEGMPGAPNRPKVEFEVFIEFDDEELDGKPVKRRLTLAKTEPEAKGT